MTTTATRIREAIITRLTPLEAWGVVRRAQTPQLQPDKLPALSVYIRSERLSPDGDSNVGEPRFVTEIGITISVVDGFQVTEDLQSDLDVRIDAIETALFRDPSFVTFDPAHCLFESIEQIERSRGPKPNGETYVFEGVLEILFRARVSFPPIIPDDLEHVRITTRQLGSDPDAPALVTEIDLPVD